MEHVVQQYSQKKRKWYFGILSVAKIFNKYHFLESVNRTSLHNIKSQIMLFIIIYIANLYNKYIMIYMSIKAFLYGDVETKGVQSQRGF